MKIVATWKDPMGFTAVDENSHTVVMDASSEAGGMGMGVSPVKLLLMGLAGCMGMDVISILRKKRQPVTGMTITVTGERQDTHPKVFREVSVDFTIQGAAVQPEAVQRALELSADRYCTVEATLRPQASVRHRFRLLDDTGETCYESDWWTSEGGA